jgi:hypothetical protein
MARSYTQNLKLIIEDNLTTVARANLERIDSLGDAFLVTSTENLEIRSANNINVRPNASEIGGTGSGGTINFGNGNHQLSALNAYTALASFTGDISIGGVLKLQSGLYSLSLQPDTLSSNVSLTLPATVGSNGQALVTNGSGVLSWQTVGGGSNPEYSAQWVTGDGTSKTVTHNLGTTDVLVYIRENSSNELLLVDSVVYVSINSIQLTATEAPGAGGWTVYILAN